MLEQVKTSGIFRWVKGRNFVDQGVKCYSLNAGVLPNSHVGNIMPDVTVLRTVASRSYLAMRRLSS
jgi:hypothetical protein